MFFKEFKFATFTNHNELKTISLLEEPRTFRFLFSVYFLHLIKYTLLVYIFNQTNNFFTFCYILLL